jgi:hypothetical protein
MGTNGPRNVDNFLRTDTTHSPRRFYRSYRQLVRLRGREIGPSKASTYTGQCKLQKSELMPTGPPIGIQIQDPSVQAVKNSTGIKVRELCDGRTH